MVTPADLSCFLAEGAIVFEAVGVGGAADNGLAAGAEGLGFLALAEGVVEDDDVGPLGVFFPVFGFGDEAVGDVALFFRLDVVADVVAFFENLPGDVADKARERNKEKFAFVHFARAQLLTANRRKIVVEKTASDCYSELNNPWGRLVGGQG